MSDSTIKKISNNELEFASIEGYLYNTSTQTLPASVYRNNNSTSSQLAHQFLVEALDSASSVFVEYGSAKVRILDPISTSAAGIWEFAVVEEGVEDVDYLHLNGESFQVDIFKNLNMNNEGILNTSLITDGLTISSPSIAFDSTTNTFNRILDMNSNGITYASFIESDTANRPGSGFIRMAFADEIRMRNSDNDNDLIIKAALPTLGVVQQDAFSFNVAGGDQMFIGAFDISVEANDILNTGDVLPSGTGGEVGDSTNFYILMLSQFFLQDAASVVVNRYCLAKT